MSSKKKPPKKIQTELPKLKGNIDRIYLGFT